LVLTPNKDLNNQHILKESDVIALKENHSINANPPNYFEQADVNISKLLKFSIQSRTTTSSKTAGGT